MSEQSSVKKLRLGVLGLGEGRSIISAALNSSLWELALLCDLNEKLCQERAAEFRFEHWTTSFDALLSDSSIDAIGIYTPDPLHAEHIEKCMRAGKHVICTKPLIDDLKSAPRVIEAQRATGKLVYVGQSSRFFEPMIRQRPTSNAASTANSSASRRTTTRTTAGSCNAPGPATAASNGSTAA
ncbi:MAG: Gfo/Idh/MocA family oxidoreductase [Tepidisphaeraceae bacterium]